MAKGLKTLDKLMDRKLDALPTSKWASAVGLWDALRKLLED